MDNKTELKWHEKPTNLIIMLVLFFPLGIYFMWKNEIWSKKTRWIITVIIAIAVISGSDDESSSSGSSNACACLKEMNTMRVNSSLYQACINEAIIAGETTDPYGYFERQCNK